MQITEKAEDAGKRYELILRILKTANDLEGLELLNDLVNSCTQYVLFVSQIERRIQRLKIDYEPREYITAVEALDRNRRIKHDALIARLYSFNRYMFKTHKGVPVGGIFSLRPGLIERREYVGDWAEYLIQYITGKRTTSQ